MNKELWGTDIRFLNDENEFFYCQKKIKKNLLRIIFNNIKNSESFSFYIQKLKEDISNQLVLIDTDTDTDTDTDKNTLSDISTTTSDVSETSDRRKKLENLKSEFDKFNDDDIRDFKANVYSYYKESMRLIDDIIKNNQINIISFTYDKDSMRQWMSYCPNGNGVCLEIETENLALNKGERIEPVKYFNLTDKNSKDNTFIINKLNEIVNKSFDLFADLAADLLMNINNLDDDCCALCLGSEALRKGKKTINAKMSQYIVNELLYLYSSVKDISFSNENEIRLIKIPYVNDFENGNFKVQQNINKNFRDKNGIIIPYHPYKISENLINNILIGASYNQELIINGLLIMTSNLSDLNHIKIEKSKVSLRMI